MRLSLYSFIGRLSDNTTAYIFYAAEIQKHTYKTLRKKKLTAVPAVKLFGDTYKTLRKKKLTAGPAVKLFGDTYTPCSFFLIYTFPVFGFSILYFSMYKLAASCGV